MKGREEREREREKEREGSTFSLLTKSKKDELKKGRKNKMAARL